MKRILAVVVLLAACSRPEQPMSSTSTSSSTASTSTTAATAAATPQSYEASIAQWQKTRAERLTSDSSWLTLAGLYWLKEGDNRIGSGKENDVVFPAKAPQSVGTLTLANGKVTLKPDANGKPLIDGKPVTQPVALLADTDPQGPTVVSFGSMNFQVIKRNDKFGVRLKDKEAEARTHFKGLEYFPTNPKWRIEATFRPYNPPKKIPITNVLGMTGDEVSPGAIVFTVDGKEYAIDPILEQGEKDYFIIFRDATAGKETYGAARYLYATPPGPDGKVVLDFNKAYNPPCAFTPYATCPLPPPQNKLPFRIEAGEKKYAGGHG